MTIIDDGPDDMRLIPAMSLCNYKETVNSVSLPTELCLTSVSRDTFKSRLKSHFYADQVILVIINNNNNIIIIIIRLLVCLLLLCVVCDGE